MQGSKKYGEFFMVLLLIIEAFFNYSLPIFIKDNRHSTLQPLDTPVHIRVT